MYRYFLKLEKHTLVMLEEELEFVSKYCDLLRERFGESFVTEIDIPDKYHGARIIPCTLQVMVENAVKHNVVNSSSALHISIGVGMRHIVVRHRHRPAEHQPSVRDTLQPQGGDRKDGLGIHRAHTSYPVDRPMRPPATP